MGKCVLERDEMGCCRCESIEEKNMERKGRRDATGRYEMIKENIL